MNTTFIDGVAQGAELLLSRSPILLRVVYDGVTKKVDALDLLDDEPRDGEIVQVYRLASQPVRGFADGRDPKTGKRWGKQFSAARYRMHDEQPPPSLWRGKKWQEWATDQVEWLKE